MNARTNSTAVMARRVEPADSLDFFPTPPWATRAFCTHVLKALLPAGTDPFWCSAIDPACGEGHMALALEEFFGKVLASDIFGYGYGDVQDFLHPDFHVDADWFITNPPFNLALEFVRKALLFARHGVAILVRLQFLEGEERLQELFAVHPPTLIAQYAERVPMHRGRWVTNGKSATAYCWVCWQKNAPVGDTRFMWIPKSRQVLAQHDDWLRFSGCEDLPKEHQAMKLADTRTHVWTPAAEKPLELLI